MNWWIVGRGPGLRIEKHSNSKYAENASTIRYLPMGLLFWKYCTGWRPIFCCVPCRTANCS